METRITAVSIRDGKGRGAGTRIEEESGAVFSIWTGETVLDVPLNVAFAAQDLLEACHGALTYMTALSNDPVNWPIAAHGIAAAIAKAEGRQP